MFSKSSQKLSFNQWMSLASDTEDPIGFVNTLMSLDFSLISGAVDGLRRYAEVGRSPSIFLNLWSLLSAQHRRELVDCLPKVLLRSGNEEVFSQMLERLENHPFIADDGLVSILSGEGDVDFFGFQIESGELECISADEMALILDCTIVHLLEYMIGIHLEEASSGAIDENRVFRLLKVLFKLASVDKKYCLEQRILETPSCYSFSPINLTQIEPGKFTENRVICLALGHYVMSVTEPVRFCEMLSAELAAVEEVLAISNISTSFRSLVSALGIFCPPLLYLGGKLDSFVNCFPTIGGMLLAYDLWLLSRTISRNSLKLSETADGALHTLHGQLLALITASDLGSREPGLMAIARGLMVEGFSDERLLELSQPLVVAPQQRVLDVLTLAMGGERCIREIAKTLGSCSTAELLLFVLSTVPGFRDNSLVQPLDALGRSRSLPKDSASRCASALAGIALNQQPGGRGLFLFTLLQDAYNLEACELPYFKALSQELCRLGDSAAVQLAGAIEGGNYGVAAAILRNAGPAFFPSLSRAKLRLLQKQVRSFACAEKSDDNCEEDHLALMNAIADCGAREFLDMEDLLMVVQGYPQSGARQLALKKLSGGFIPSYMMGEAAREELRLFFQGNCWNDDVVAVMARSYLPQVEKLVLVDEVLATRIMDRATDAAFLPGLAETEKVDILREVLKMTESWAAEAEVPRTLAYLDFIEVMLPRVGRMA